MSNLKEDALHFECLIDSRKQKSPQTEKVWPRLI